MVTPLATLHPTVRRKFLAAAPHDDAHETVLRALGGGGPATFVVTMTEESFVEAIMVDLQAADWRTRLARRQGSRRGGDGTLELGQPIHRRFHLALFEAYCRTPGSPRLDPQKIDGMGLVLRREMGEHIGRGRLRIPGRGGAVNRVEDGWEGWMSDAAVRRGWLPIAAEDLDPDPSAQNRTRTASQSRAIQTLIDQRRGGRRIVEQVMPLFVAPPEVCEALGKTVLYGVTPVASPEETDTPPAPPNYATLPEAQEMRAHLSSYLKQRAGQALPRANDRLEPSWQPLQTPVTGESAEGRLYSLALFLQQVMVELGGFENTGAANELMRLLGQIPLPTAKDEFGRVTASISAAEFARRAGPVLVGGEPNGSGLHMPLEWPSVGADLGGRLTAAALACLAERFSQLVPKIPKFHGDEHRYSVRGFLRVRVDPACPAALIWSDYSEPFRVLPWWDSDGPVARIPLPSLSKLKNLKPNVSFEMPPEIAALVQGDPKKLSDGEGSAGGVDIFWLCSFSLPIITICAFIVLSIFLGILNLILSWMAWIKICIPIPRPR